jgi:hypothetical protein
MSNLFKQFLCWLLPGTLAFVVALGWAQGSYVDGDYLPMGHDAFYHAHRILDGVQNLSAFYEFDPAIHAPEGSWITWPWFYDWFLACLTIVMQWLTQTGKPMAVLVFIPALWVYINAALLLGIGSVLGLSFYARVVLMLSYALSPLTLGLHGVGALDHHFMEQTCVFAVLITGMRWFRDTESRKNSVLFGCALGFSLGIHNGLFILLVPLVGIFLLLWRDGNLPRRDSVRWFLSAYLVALILMLIPSEPFRQGFFQYYTLSWFHLYAGFVVSGIVFYLQQVPATRGNFIKLLFGLVVLSLPVLQQLNVGMTFVFGKLYNLSSMTESVSLWGMLVSEQWSIFRISQFYSLFVWLLPITLWIILKNLYQRDGRGAMESFFWVYALFGLFMLVQQHRFHHFGSFALVLPLLIMFDKAWWPGLRARYKQLFMGGSVALALLPGIGLLASSQPQGLDKDHQQLRPFYLALAKICDASPGVVLANMNDGHYISYYTKCAVIADNFIQTQQHIDKIKLSERFFSMPVEQVIEEAPWIDYYFVRIFKSDVDTNGFPPQDIRNHLLPTGVVEPGSLRLLVQSNARITLGDDHVALAKIYGVNRTVMVSEKTHPELSQ